MPVRQTLVAIVRQKLPSKKEVILKQSYENYSGVVAKHVSYLNFQLTIEKIGIIILNSLRTRRNI